MREGTRVRAGAWFAFAAFLAFACVVAAETPPAKDAGDASLHDRAKAILDAHCIFCREDTQSADGPILSLEDIADDPGLVVPGRPDASPLYLRLVSARLQREAKEGEKASAPPLADIETIRNWIASLPSRESGCRDRNLVSANDLSELVGRWTEEVGAERAAATRFVSLAHLWNACAAPMRMMELRIATATLLGALTGRREGLQLETLGEKSVLLAIRPGEEALAGSDWDRLTANAPLSASGAVPADWLAAHVLSERKDTDGKAATIGQAVLDAAGERAISSLASHWTRDVDLVRAAAERGVAPEALRKTLMKAEGDVLVPSRRLAYGAVSREVWQRIWGALDGGAKARVEKEAEQETTPRSGAVDIVLWPDQPSYRPRDLVTFNVRVDKACHLTLIGIDGDGQATVLFPNELESENLVAPSVIVRVPGNEAGYQFRFDKAGEETVLAICQRDARRPQGIAYDYERQRFALLGDWREFLRTAEAREKDIRAKREAQEARRKRRGRAPAEKEPPPVASEDKAGEGRTAITIVIEPGGGPL